MEKLPLLEQETLKILEQLDFGCVQFEQGNKKGENESGKGIEVPINDIKLTPFLKLPGKLDTIERFLQSKELNFSSSSDIIKRPFKSLNGAIMGDTVNGTIKGKNIQDIEAKIKEITKKLNSGVPTPEEKNISEEREPANRVVPLSEKGKGYLIFHGEKISIGEVNTGKFRLLETLCTMGLRKGKSINAVFDYIKTEKDKNKSDQRLESLYQGRNIKLELIKNQMREINRAITEHVKKMKGKKIKLRLKIKTENDNVWMEERVGRRG